MNKKTLLALSVTAAVFSQTSVLQAQTIHTEFDGLFTMLDQGTPIQNASSSLIYYNDQPGVMA